MPTASTSKLPTQWSPSTSRSIQAIGSSRQPPSGERWRRKTRIASWPSRKTSAETSTRSPTVRLIGKRPPSTCGWRSRMRMRGGAGSVGAGASPLVAGTASFFGFLVLDTGIEPPNSPQSFRANSDHSSFSSVMARLSGSTAPERVNGVQMHPTSLPGGRLGPEAFEFVDWLPPPRRGDRQGGRLGPEAFEFVDWLAAAGQSYWQVLPLGPVGEGGSPYKSPSAFAGSPALLAEPRAPVAAEELDALREREAYWLPDWERYAGAGG